MFTKKHFEKFAEEIRDLKELHDLQEVDQHFPEAIANFCAVVFERTNQNFDKYRFFKACGLKND